MNESSVLSALIMRYPGRRVLRLPPDGPARQIVCEMDPPNGHPDHSSLVTIIDRLPPHLHREAQAVYKVLEGRLEIDVAGAKVSLEEGDSLAVPSTVIHSAQGDSTWVQIDFTPGWNAKDHVFVPEDI